MATVKLVLDKRSVKKDGTHPVKLYVSHNRKDFRLPTPISIREADWIEDSQNYSRTKRINDHLKQILRSAEDVIFNLSISGKLQLMDLASLKCAIEGKESVQSKDAEHLLSDVFNSFISQKSKPNTAQKYQQTIDKITKLLGKDVFLEEINVQWLKDFERRLLQGEKLAINTVGIHLRNIRAVMNDAINEDVIPLDKYPFRKFKIKKEATVKRALTVDELRMLRTYVCQEHQEKYRDVFMLIFYLIGINIVDLSELKCVTNGRVEYRRAKTGRLYSIQLHPEAMALIDKYKGNEKLLNFFESYANYKDFAKRTNDNLKEIGNLEWVLNSSKNKKNKKSTSPLFPNLTTYVARHVQNRFALKNSVLQA